MKLVMFSSIGEPWHAGLLEGDQIIDLDVPDILDGLELVRTGNFSLDKTYALSEVKLGPPAHRPPSFRDFFSFEMHVANARRNRGAEVPAQWYEIPVFYFSNPTAFLGHNEPLNYPWYSQQLDLEQEVGIIIGKSGKNIPAEQAHEYIAGFMILNDWSARDVQMQEMAVGLGPAKGKDFATSIGPYLVTPDELADRLQPDGRYNLETVWKLNGQEKYRNNLSTQHWTFGQCIERASQNVWLRRGDVIGSGTVGNGCLLEEGERRERYLQVGDIITIEIERLGTLQTQVIEPNKERH